MEVVIKCKTCGEVFVASGKGCKVRSRCSDKCKGFSTKCLVCGKTFQAEKPRFKYCSNECRGVAYSLVYNRTRGKRSTRVCQQCGVTYVISGDRPNFGFKLRTSKYCSSNCSNAFNGTEKRVAVGTEKIRYINGDKEDLLVMTKNGWKRKCCVVLEGLIRRRLTHGEMNLITFIDGNRLNCDPDNLLLRSSQRQLIACTVCGKVRLVRKTSDVRGRCSNCARLRLRV